MPTRPHTMPRQPHPRTSRLALVPSESEIFRAAPPLLVASHDDPYFETPIGIDTRLLVDAASHALGIDEVPKITLAYAGGCNAAFLLDYSSLGRSVAARFPLKWVRDALRVEPAAATMLFARHVLGLPVPEVLAWNATYDNPLGVPYLFLEYIPHCREAWDRVYDQPEDRGPFLQALARCHAALARPLPPHLQGVGQLAFSPQAEDPSYVMSYVLRPLSFRGTLEYGFEEPVGAFHARSTSLPEVWREMWEFEHRALDDSQRGLNVAEWSLLEDSDTAQDPECNKTAFLAASGAMRIFYQHALDVLRQYPALETSCLVNLDYAYRNILIDETSLELKGLVDWDDVYVMPFAISMDYPLDLLEESAPSRRILPPSSEYVREGYFRSFPHSEYGEIREIVDFTAPDSQDICTRNGLIYETRERDWYRATLAACDARFGDPQLWEARKPILKAQQLLKWGGRTWWSDREWLQAEVTKQ
ncbi:hypothetical protein EXIGLDRAFT_768772 [Exidia glandulosa HHB12029]|uniref:Aminoglycoside phosphotransferase domain-containing protein n=1 Tax=Exidia glandulosa HHB12029 TaxID=1314781 RepID=A0A165HZ02_EXIGL|nr:hypothetical protein EXIGLDRAFT_768772 [Exidia glandulosa HHB12029]